jgi:CelD/BcsL family acetyltransferase involved in cellulose biosynthesis
MSRGAGQATRNLDVEVLTELPAVEAIAPEWNRLAEERSAQPFALPGLALAWWRELGKGGLSVVTVRNGRGALVGVGPLFSRPRGRLMTLSFLGRGLGAVGQLLIAPAKADIAGVIWSALDPDSVLDLVDYRHRGDGFESLRRHDQWLIHAELSDECPVVDLTGVTSVEEFLAAPQRSGLRKKLAKARRSLPEECVSMAVYTEPSDIEAEWNALRSLYDRAEGANPRLHLGRPPLQAFFDSALRDLAAEGQVAITTLTIKGRRAAFDVYVLSGSTAYAILGRFDPDLRDHSPGQLLTERGVQWAIDAGYTTIDLQLGGDLYKQRWSTGSYDTLDVVAATNGHRVARARATLGAVETAYSVKQQLNQAVNRWRE